ncbi:nuclear transport factor 2 family protein [Bradyrhizobium septentrionale]|nr:nuclear transport factor 2 family protein [Bradyrhizobium septentrionale]UGY14885.1 nuclear transport factor 2 family protein [Bradyrhizobium septentrionale]
MTEHDGKTLAIARAYVEAIANKDVDTIISISTDDVVCNSPRGRLTGTQAFRGFHEGFARMIKKVVVLAAFGDDEHAVVVYHAETHPVPNSTVAELLKIKNGKIASTEVIYDATPFAAYAATVAPQ